MSDPEYCYPPSFKVLKNKLNIRDRQELDYFERISVSLRFVEVAPIGDFDLLHLRAIHRHLFQDVYDWAGELRLVEISKDGHQFQFRRYIETGMRDVHSRLVARNYLRDRDVDEFAFQAGAILGDVNYVHPFREGNGRTQMLYLEQLACQAGHPIDLEKIDREAWMEASRRAHVGDYRLMSECIANAIVTNSDP